MVLIKRIFSIDLLVFLGCFCCGLGASLQASSLVEHCDELEIHAICGTWNAGGYFSISPEGYWFSGAFAGGEVYLDKKISLGVSLSPGLSDGAYFVAPGVELSYYLWQNDNWDLVAGYSARYFYEWTISGSTRLSEGTFHGPGLSLVYGFSRNFYTGLNVSYQWVAFSGELLREWYLTVPATWVF